MKNDITTHEYQGYHMRSHSETRWAQMMDALRITWVYEPDLIKTRHGMYLPDFYLPHVGIYLEVKGPRPNQVELEKAEDAQRATGVRVVFAYGDMRTEGPNHVQGGFFLLRGRFDWVQYSTYEFGPIIQKGLGHEAWMRYLRAGLKASPPCVAMIGDLVRDLLLNMVDRSVRERQLSANSRALNHQKSEQHSVITLPEWALRNFFTRNAIAQEAA